ncbi:MAG: hypothetical protein CMF74_19180 [Maricaulis sp.]|nr:hypothetical protein [Maricaulis sp.]
MGSINSEKWHFTAFFILHRERTGDKNRACKLMCIVKCIAKLSITAGGKIGNCLIDNINVVLICS